MRAIIQRVKRACILKDNNPSQILSSINNGMLVLIGFINSDTEEEAKKFTEKIVKLRIFSDSSGKINLSANDINAEFLFVSQFTLYANTKHGLRPSFEKAAGKEKAEKMYNIIVSHAKNIYEKDKIKNGPFGAYLGIELLNDGPVTIWLDSSECL